MNEPKKPSSWKSNDPRQRLHDIVERGKSILETTKGLDQEAFESDTVLYKAVCYDMLCLSEAVGRLLVLEPAILERYPEIPWHQVRAIANILRHGYGDVDLDILWNAIVGGELQALIAAAEADIASK